MTTYIAHFTASHRIVQVQQNSIFVWQQESGEVDLELLSEKIRREAATPFFRLLAGQEFPLTEADMQVKVHRTEPY
ncbi:GTP-binding protein LepA [Robiginitalea sp. M366]|uniref:GTP-binding protein LepA n=1 Tax=Robiginitalea aestuariiviva TaxID=3036903 RepID=UPI00240DF5B7|nr:GTP-binding protein LepA [Robiginitalea aestuariiviva]MDG1571532.1 GTP-binding protein LepA [Robiginitalea aestuariiviva]